jgi:hypothetical protein
MQQLKEDNRLLLVLGIPKEASIAESSGIWFCVFRDPPLRALHSRIEYYQNWHGVCLVVANEASMQMVEGSIPTAPRSSYNGSCSDHGLEGNLVKLLPERQLRRTCRIKMEELIIVIAYSIWACVHTAFFYLVIFGEPGSDTSWRQQQSVEG